MPNFFQSSSCQIWETSHAIRWVESCSRCVLHTHVMEIWVKGVLLGFIQLNCVSAVESLHLRCPFPLMENELIQLVELREILHSP